MNIKLHLEILSKLESKQIDYCSAFEQLKKLPKAWGTKEWKEISKELKKDFCEVCNSKEGTLVLQHTIQPTPFKEMKEKVAFERLVNSKRDFNAYASKQFNLYIDEKIKTGYKIRSGCPTCYTVNIRERKTMQPRFVCGNGHYFEERIDVKYYKEIHTSGEEKARTKFSNEYKYFFLTSLLYKYIKQNDEEIGRLSLIESIKESIEYFSMKNTKTACKKCAFKEDLPYMYKI
jgi:hypothetical protein